MRVCNQDIGRSSLYLLAFVFSLSICAPPLSYAKDISEKIVEYLDAVSEVDDFSGSVLIAMDNKVILSKGYGMSNYEHDIHNQRNTKFRLASITKTFTALSILQLQEENLLDVLDPVSKYLPDYPYGDKINVKQLLSHTSGIVNYTNLSTFKEIEKDPTDPDAIMEVFKGEPLDFKPGSQYSYSNSGYILLGLIIEKVSGKTYQEYLEEAILRPLNMTNTGYDNNRPVIKNRATGYVSTENGLVHAPYIDMSVPFAAGGIYSTVEDLYKLDRALYSNTLISAKSKQSMFTPVFDNYAYGWFVHEAFGRKMISHDGEIYGFQTFFGRYPDDNIVIAVLSNVQNTNVSQISQILSAILFGEPYAIPKIHREVDIDPTVYNRYIGTYKFGMDFTMDITTKSGDIFAQVAGTPVVEIFPESGVHFFIKAFDAQLSFILDNKGEAVELILHQYGTDRKAKKIK